MSGKNLLLCSALTGLLMLGSEAHAQAKDSDEIGATGDIVVTAQRRSERLQDVPMSITALSQDALAKAGVTATPDLVRVTPGLTMNFYGLFLQPAIRGVTSAGANVGESSNVATYIDGVYQPQQIATLLELPDVQQIEVLKGPQGALYGQNATGGAILITSVTPDSTPHGSLSASYGKYNDVNLRGYVTGPIAEGMSASIAGGYRNRDGHRRNVVTNQRDFGLDSQVVRGKLLLEPVDGFRITLGGYYSDLETSSNNAGFPINNNTVANFILPSAPRVTDPKRQYGNSPDAINHIRSWGGNVRAEIETGAGTLNSVASLAKNKVNYLSDIDFSPVNYAEAFTPNLSGKYFIWDTNFVSRKFGPVSFLAGVFYLNGNETFHVNGFRLLDGALLPAPRVVTFESRTYGRVEKQIIAGYAEATIQATDQFVLTAGGRYSHETQRGFSGIPAAITTYPGNPVHFNKFTPRVTGRFDITPDANVYVSWGKGYKSGGINLTRFDLPPVRPENITAYEIGFKGRIADTLRLNASAFLYNYKDLQLVQYAPPAYYEENAAEARIKGFEFDIAWDITPELRLSGGGSYLDAHYRNAVATIFIPTGFGDIPTPGVNISGNRLIRAPEFSGNVALNYRVDTALGRIGAYASLYYSSGHAMEASNRIRQGAYETVDAELSLEPAGIEGLRLVVWGKNLTDEAYYATLIQSPFGDGATYSDPRTFGVRAEFKF